MLAEFGTVSIFLPTIWTFRFLRVQIDNPSAFDVPIGAMLARRNIPIRRPRESEWEPVTHEAESGSSAPLKITTRD